MIIGGRVTAIGAIVSGRLFERPNRCIFPRPFPEILMRVFHAAILLVTLPVVLEAQQPPAGQTTNPITTVFRNRTLAQQRNLAQAFDSIPASLFSYKPTPAQQTIGYIAQHLAEDNYF